MADRNPTQPRSAPRHNNSSCSVASFLRNLQFPAPNHSQLARFFTLAISGSILLLLAGITVTATVLGLIIFAPLILISSPVWVPVGTFLLIGAAGVLSVCGFGVVAAAVMSWIYRYYRGLDPPGSGRVDYARSRIYATASHVKDYAREYGGYLQSKVKDAAPGA